MKNTIFLHKVKISQNAPEMTFLPLKTKNKHKMTLSTCFLKLSQFIINLKHILTFNNSFYSRLDLKIWGKYKIFDVHHTPKLKLLFVLKKLKKKMHSSQAYSMHKNAIA